MNNPAPPTSGIERFIPGIALYIRRASHHILLANLKQLKSQDANIATQDNLR